MKNNAIIESRKIRIVAAWLFLLVSLQIYLGYRVSQDTSAQTCNTFPACYNEIIIGQNGEKIKAAIYFPPMINGYEKHMSHRLLSYTISILAIFQLIIGKFLVWPKKALNLTAIIVLLILFEIYLGAMGTILVSLIWLKIIHTAIAYLILFLTGWIILVLYGRKKQSI